MRHPLRTWAALFPAVCALLVGQAVASPEPRAVLELFVSQGCSACRPANELMAEWKRDPSLVVMSLPVNYWDYLGWKDTQADPLFTARQKGYAKARRGQRVYTPEMVVNGVVSCVGSARDQVVEAVDRTAPGTTPLPVAIRVREENGLVIVDVGEGTGEAEAWLLPVRRHSQVAIHRGENAGRTETYTNVVRAVLPLGTWAGATVRFEMPLEAVRTKDADAYVVLLQKARDGHPGRILGAAKGPGL
ncbi:DUF1223 domain-containing protein [Microvirga thermotolerans]|uniref:DUF1223 domain-containing protein n=1 Tax=Microvirga thermotolerans TaxID=2651334 RepID=A0A5P9JSZ4_9HYPH|nr:DUF1223 domain-containing protein [Microvirga thermotolerans]QFU14746.1 DUF1223 domain-containing protein [Microvirga thermotolerans]